MEEELLKAKKKAMNLLLHNDRTEKQLRDKLKTAGFSEVAEEEAVSYVKSFGYIDDYRYARRYVEIYQNRKSRQQLVVDLQRKGVSQECIGQAIEEEWQGDDAALKHYLDKKTRNLSDMDYQTRKKLAASLYRKGFSLSDIHRFLDL